MGNSIPEQIIAGIFADTDLQTYITGVQGAVGLFETGVHAAPPRIVAVPRGAPEISEPDRPGDPGYDDQGRQLLLRHFRVDWQCHGAPTSVGVDFAPAENLYLETVRAIRRACHHAVRFENEVWEDQQDGKDGVIKHGNLISFTTVIQIPIYERRATSPLAEVETIETTANVKDGPIGDAVVITEPAP